MACTVFRSREESVCLFLAAMGKDDESSTEFYIEGSGIVMIDPRVEKPEVCLEMLVFAFFASFPRDPSNYYDCQDSE